MTKLGWMQTLSALALACGLTACLTSEGGDENASPGDTSANHDTTTSNNVTSANNTTKANHDTTTSNNATSTNNTTNTSENNTQTGCTPNRSACNPDDLSKVFQCRYPGIYGNVNRNCAAGEQCQESSTGAECVEVANASTNNTSGNNSGGVMCNPLRPTCNPADRANVYDCADDGSGYGDIDRPCSSGTECRVVDGYGGCYEISTNNTSANNTSANNTQTECTPNRSVCNPDDPSKVFQCTGSGTYGNVNRNCIAPEVCVETSSSAECGDQRPPGDECVPGEHFCDPSDYTKVFKCDDLGYINENREQQCNTGEVCITQGASAAMGAVCVEGRVDEDGNCHPTGTLTQCMTDIPKPGGGVYEEGFRRQLSCTEAEVVPCDEGLYCMPIDLETLTGEVQCSSSVADENSPWWGQSCLRLDQLTLQTELPADCRCLTNRAPRDGVDPCTSASVGTSRHPAAPTPQLSGEARNRFGTGPTLAGVFNGHYSGGFISGGELIVAAYWEGSSSPKGYVAAVDLSTGDRRAISGTIPTNAGDQQVGTGVSLKHVIDVRAYGGSYYALSTGSLPQEVDIVRINPSTGARTLVWRAPPAATPWAQASAGPYGQCISGDGVTTVQYTKTGFAIDGQGNFYLGYANPIRDGRGIVRIGANGSSCSYVTATGGRADGLTRGSGGALGGFVQGYTFHQGQLWAFTTQPKALWKINPSTGDRVAELTAQAGGIIGERWPVWDPVRDVMWTVGFQNSVTITALDLTSKTLIDIFSSCGSVSWMPLCVEGPARISSQNYGGAWIEPGSGRMFIAQESDSIVEIELETGNSMIFSR